MSLRRGKNALWILLGAATLLAVAGALDPSGLGKSVRLLEECDRLAEENGRLLAENARLAREAHALVSDPRARERAAREELRFIRPGELIYRLDGAPKVAP